MKIRGSRRSWLARFSCLALLTAQAPALAQSSSDDLARPHFESGAAYLEESDYDHALEAFQKAYDLSKRPEILLNIATVHERKAELQPAIDALNQFLSVAPPNDEQIDAVKLRIQNLQKRLADDSARVSATPAPPSAPPTQISTPTTAPLAPVAPPAPTPSSSSARLPAFIALGIGGLAAGGAVVTGIIANSDYQDAKSSCSPACTDSQLSAGRAMALTSTILTAVAVVGVGVGVTLLFTSGPDPAQTSLVPRLHLAGGTSATRADATWRF
ncbi:MAG TPA: tetratricopeptide repeat protein [Polyangiaceae bacterium]|jgi:hypothetical protein|nr:tetratricopeptide repeat protein [Polyangiaceae bacterium]